MPKPKTKLGGRLLIGNCLETLKTLADASIDSIVTDPPYELGFMGKSWDASGIAFNVEVWQECLRVLKPGGHLLAFSGSRTYHRMAVAIEDAGFEIRDQIMWIYGSGFPKSLNISKAIDKASGKPRKSRSETRIGETGYDKEMPQVRARRCDGCGKCVGGTKNHCQCPADNGPQTKAAIKWDGWGTALKPSHEPIVVARKPLIGTVAANVLTYGTGGLNIDGARVVSDDWDAQKVLAKYTGNNNGNDSVTRNFGVKEIKSTNTESTLIGRWPANVIHDGSDEVVELFPDTGKSTGGRIGKKSMGNVTNVPAGEYEAGDPGYGDSGSAARFFYCAKASKKERDAGLADLPEQEYVQYQTANGTSGKASSLSEGRDTKYRNIHPTVKPVQLMRYLIRMVTPPKGTVLDPFLGSGTTAVAAVLEGFDWKGCEKTTEYLPIIEGRVKWANKEKKKK